MCVVNERPTLATYRFPCGSTATDSGRLMSSVISRTFLPFLPITATLPLPLHAPPQFATYVVPDESTATDTGH